MSSVSSGPSDPSGEAIDRDSCSSHRRNASEKFVGENGGSSMHCIGKHYRKMSTCACSIDGRSDPQRLVPSGPGLQAETSSFGRVSAVRIQCATRVDACNRYRHVQLNIISRLGRDICVACVSLIAQIVEPVRHDWSCTF